MNFPDWLVFTALTFLISIPLYLLARRTPSEEKEAALERVMRQLMWVPGIVAFGLRAFSGRGFLDLNLSAGREPWLLLGAFLLPIGMELLLIIAALRFNLGFIDGDIYAVRDGWVYVSQQVRMLLGSGKQAPFKLWLNLVGTVGLGVAFTLIFSFAEEFGWRGTLQGELVDRFTLTWGLVLGGLIWGFWHAPIVLAGYRFPAYPRLGAYVFMPVYTIALGIVAGWFYFLSGSLWAPAILNASARVSGRLSEVALGEAGNSRRVRVVWLWLWAVLGGLGLSLWWAGQ